MSSELEFVLTEVDSFGAMLFHVFFWAFISSLAVHVIGSLIAFRSLRKHKYARYSPIFILISGILTPLTMGLITSATIAGIYRAANFKMSPTYAAFYGIGQTFVNFVFSFTRLLATL